MPMAEMTPRAMTTHFVTSELITPVSEMPPTITPPTMSSVQPSVPSDAAKPFTRTALIALTTMARQRCTTPTMSDRTMPPA